jgi:hypothetical protein
VPACCIRSGHGSIRLQYEEDEEACDICQESQQQIQLQQAQERILTRLEGSEAVRDPGHDDIEFEQQQSQRSWIDFHAREVKQEEAYAVEELERQLRRFQQRYAWCYIHGQAESSQHRLADCSIGQASRVQEYCKDYITAVQKKETIEGYSYCLYYYVPQAIYQH